jgi:hypothetical protein
MAQPSYDQLVAALLAVRPDHASARFDEELTAAEAAGRLDRTTALTLRWWQRQSVAALEEHISAALPQVLATLAAADSAARESLDAAAAAWAAAQPPAPAAEPVAAAVPDDAPEPGTSHVTLAPVTELPMRAPDHDRPGPGFTSHLHPVAPADGNSTDPAGGTGAPRPRLLGSGLTVRGQARRPEDR